MNELTTRFLVFAIVMLFAIPLHEFAHALAAQWSGDDIPGLQGRVTPEPWAHWDVAGSLLIGLGIFFNVAVIGWGKPVVTDPANYRNGKWGRLLVAVAGILMNVILATAAGIIFRSVPAARNDPLLSGLLIQFVVINCSLALFNLLPIPPLDGSKVLSTLLPLEKAIRIDSALAPVSWVVLYAIVIFGSRALWSPVVHLAHWLLGA